MWSFSTYRNKVNVQHINYPLRAAFYCVFQSRSVLNIPYVSTVLVFSLDIKREARALGLTRQTEGRIVSKQNSSPVYSQGRIKGRASLTTAGAPTYKGRWNISGIHRKYGDG
jgi:hypothetical protein